MTSFPNLSVDDPACLFRVYTPSSDAISHLSGMTTNSTSVNHSSTHRIKQKGMLVFSYLNLVLPGHIGVILRLGTIYRGNLFLQGRSAIVMIRHHWSLALIHLDNVKGRCRDGTGFDRHGSKVKRLRCEGSNSRLEGNKKQPKLRQ